MYIEGNGKIGISILIKMSNEFGSQDTVRDCRGKPTAPARTCSGKPDRLRERPKNIPTTYHGTSYYLRLICPSLFLFVLKSDGLGKEQTDYKLCSVFDQFALRLNESFASCQ